MLDKKSFEAIRAELGSLEAQREEMIAASRDVITLSKRIIYAVQRDELAAAAKLVKEIGQKIKPLQNISVPLDTNMPTVALQEYVEARCLYEFVKQGTLPPPSALGVGNEEYLLGLCDLTGELGRKAVYYAIHKKFDSVRKIKELVEEIYGEFLQLNLRNGELRKKSDAIKWNLLKIEQMMYDITMKAGTGFLEKDSGEGIK